MAPIVRHASPFAETEKPPPPVVLLLLQTDLDMHTSTGLLIHEDLESLVPSTKKKVVFAQAPMGHSYPPQPILEAKIPAPPKDLTRRVIEHHEAWSCSTEETRVIKATVHQLVETLLDTTKSFAAQNEESVQDVYRQAAYFHSYLGRFESNWATYCIVQARLKATSAATVRGTTKKIASSLEDLVHDGRKTRSQTKQELFFEVESYQVRTHGGSTTQMIRNVIAQPRYSKDKVRTTYRLTYAKAYTPYTSNGASNPSHISSAPDSATVAPQKVNVPGERNKKETLTGGMRAERAAGGKKCGEAGTSGANHACKTTLQAYTTTLQAYNALQCWWLVRGKAVGRVEHPAGVQRLAVLVAGKRQELWEESNPNVTISELMKLKPILRKMFLKLLLHSIHELPRVDKVGRERSVLIDADYNAEITDVT
ncbi:hypothetical protein FB451DRAFT_1186763 [Mycena latifolia]|nr:hypothetical protein FB451DRAFT_1186763 [Mycena latifolia]